MNTLRDRKDGTMNEYSVLDANRNAENNVVVITLDRQIKLIKLLSKFLLLAS